MQAILSLALLFAVSSRGPAQMQAAMVGLMSFLAGIPGFGMFVGPFLGISQLIANSIFGSRHTPAADLGTYVEEMREYYGPAEVNEALQEQLGGAGPMTSFEHLSQGVLDAVSDVMREQAEAVYRVMERDACGPRPAPGWRPGDTPPPAAKLAARLWEECSRAWIARQWPMYLDDPETLQKAFYAQGREYLRQGV